MPKLRTRGIVKRDGYYGHLRKVHKCTYTNILQNDATFVTVTRQILNK